MFGYVRPANSELKVWELEYYKAVYCGVCRALSKRYGLLSRNLLQYDFVFLALLLEREKPCPKKRRCPVHPVRGCPAASVTSALEAAADATVLCAYYKLLDERRDGGRFKSLIARLLLVWLKPKYKAAALRLPDTDRVSREALEELYRLEDANTPSIDAAADTFARILSAMSEAAPEPEQRALKSLLYHMGRFIYIIDACDDLESDAGRGVYNPVAARFGLKPGEGLDGEAEKELEVTLAFSRDSAHLAFELMPQTLSRGIIKNILGAGLDAVTAKVLPRKRRKKGESR